MIEVVFNHAKYIQIAPAFTRVPWRAKTSKAVSSQRQCPLTNEETLCLDP